MEEDIKNIKNVIVMIAEAIENNNTKGLKKDVMNLLEVSNESIINDVVNNLLS